MAETFGKLPSEVLATATTQDLLIHDAVLSYRKYVEDQRENKTPNIRQEELEQALESVKKE